MDSEVLLEDVKCRYCKEEIIDRNQRLNHYINLHRGSYMARVAQLLLGENKREK